MGSGYFPDDVFGHKSYFNFVTYQNAWSRKDYGPDKRVGCSLQFGGPWGKCGD